jgi:hypothetical protein
MGFCTGQDCCVLALFMSAVLLSSCGDKSGKRESAAVAQSDDDSADSESNPAASSKTPEKVKGKKSAGKGGRIGEIPLDAWPEVWFEQPLSVAAASGPAAVSAATDVAPDARPVDGKTPVESVRPAAARDAETTSGLGAWASLISGEELADEAKAIKNSLTPNLQDVGRYNSKWKDVQVDATMLTVLAGIARDVPESPSWKQHAKYIRDAASQIASESKANGPKFYQKAREAYDKLNDLLSGNKPAGLEESADDVKFSEVANRPFLMKRMDRGSNWMKTEINTESLFKKNSARVAHEAAILSLLGKVIATADYGDHDDPEYVKSAEELSQSGRDIDEAVKKEDFKAYTDALDRGRKACAKCHEAFKNS